MTDEKNETWADIVAEMRDFAIVQERYRCGGADCDVVDPCWIVKKYADRFEAAAKREIPQPDPDWKDICAKCMDGDIEPDCKYYGEPNGCNSPIYGEHPKTKKVGDAAKLREAVAEIRNRLVYLYGRTDGTFDPPALQEVCEIAEDALSAPPRNCDVGTAREQEQRYLKLKKEHVDRLTFCPHVGYAAFFPDSLYWAQMPYEASQEGANNGSRQ